MEALHPTGSSAAMYQVIFFNVHKTWVLQFRVQNEGSCIFSSIPHSFSLRAQGEGYFT